MSLNMPSSLFVNEKPAFSFSFEIIVRSAENGSQQFEFSYEKVTVICQDRLGTTARKMENGIMIIAFRTEVLVRVASRQQPLREHPSVRLMEEILVLQVTEQPHLRPDNKKGTESNGARVRWG